MKYRPYQIEDAKFLATLKAGACFNQQRTGKTPTSLGVVRLKGLTKVMIVCPASAMYAWKEEYERWLEHPCVVVDGTRAKKEKIVSEWTHGLIISYDTLKNTQNKEGFLALVLAEKPEMLIADEIHRIAGRSTAIAKAMFYLGYRIEHKLALTGTPAPSRPENIWSIMHFLFPRKYTSYHNWIDEFCICVEQYLPGGNVHKNVLGIKPDKKQELADELATFTTMRKRKDVMEWLPDKEYEHIKLPPTTDQIRYWAELKEYYAIEGTDIVTKGTLDRLIRYRQICLDPKLLGLKGTSPKTDWLIQYIKDYPEENIIIFSNFTQYLKAIHEKVPSARMIIGETTLIKRAELCQLFQAGRLKILLINIQAGKEALTLDNATTTIFTDKYPPIGSIEQAEDRFVATTVARKDQQSKIIELMMANSYDVEIYKLLRQRKNEVDIVNNYNKYVGG